MKPITPFPARPLPRHPKLWWSRLKWRWPMLVWIIVAGFTYTLYQRSGSAQAAALSCEGVVEPLLLHVAPDRTRTIVAMPVSEGDTFAAGDLLVRFADLDLQAQLAGLDARLEAAQIQARQRAEEARQRNQRELRDLELAEAADRANATVFGDELTRREALLQRGLVTDQDLARTRGEAKATEARLALYPELKARIQADIDLWTARAAQEALPDDATLMMRRERLALEAQIAALSIHATEAGTVSSRLRQPGETVPPGESVLSWVPERHPRRCVAFLPEGNQPAPTPGSPCTLTLVSQPDASFGGTILALSPEVMTIPDRASPLPNRTVRGRRITITPAADAPALLPGATVLVEWAPLTTP